MRTPISKPKALRNIMILAFSLRVLPLIIWSKWPCIRDECTYLRIADRMIDGEGMTSSAGWLWAPGYPTFVALHQWLFGQGGFVKGTQILLSIGIVYLLYMVSYHTWTSILSTRLSEKSTSEQENKEEVSQRAEHIALWSAFLYACSPTQIFFTDSLWSECVYGGLLLLVVYFFQQFLQSKHIRYVFFVGIGVGICILFRGVATYMVPIFLFATLWKSWKDTEAYRSAAILGLVVFLTVLPYSAYISKKFDHFIISDRTLGQMMWLGNNDFTPVTFDSGNGQLSGAYFPHIQKWDANHVGQRANQWNERTVKLKMERNGFSTIQQNFFLESHCVLLKYSILIPSSHDIFVLDTGEDYHSG